MAVLSGAKIFHLKDAAGRPFAGVPKADSAPCIFEPDPAEDLPPPDPMGLSRDALLLYASRREAEIFRNLGLVFFNKVNVPNFEKLDGIKMLMGKPIFSFLLAVARDDMQRAIELLLTSGRVIRPHLNIPSFFFANGSSDTCFVTPAHLVRSFDMAHFLATHAGVRFDVPDSEGRLPQLHWARRASDDSLFAYGAAKLNMNMNDGGQIAGVVGEAHPAPIWEAIDRNNPHAVKGLSLCGGTDVNAPRAGDPAKFTPLMIQTVKADHAVKKQGELPLKDTLKTAWNLARSPHISWDRADWEGHTLADYPLDARVRRLLDTARARPWTTDALGLGIKFA